MFRYTIARLYQEFEYFMNSHFKSYHYQGFLCWLHGRLYKLFQPMTPFLKWSRWTFNQCLKSYRKTLELETNTAHVRSTNIGKTISYNISVRFGLLRITKITYLNEYDENADKITIILRAMANPKGIKPREIKTLIFSKFIFTKNKALKSINEIKQLINDDNWYSKYSSYNTYYIESIINKKIQLTSDNLAFAIDYLEYDNATLDDPLIGELTNVINTLSRNIKRNERKILYYLEQILEEYKTLGYNNVDENDFRL